MLRKRFDSRLVEDAVQADQHEFGPGWHGVTRSCINGHDFPSLADNMDDGAASTCQGRHPLGANHVLAQRRDKLLQLRRCHRRLANN